MSRSNGSLGHPGPLQAAPAPAPVGQPRPQASQQWQGQAQGADPSLSVHPEQYAGGQDAYAQQGHPQGHWLPGGAPIYQAPPPPQQHYAPQPVARPAAPQAQQAYATGYDPNAAYQQPAPQHAQYAQQQPPAGLSAYAPQPHGHGIQGHGTQGHAAQQADPNAYNLGDYSAAGLNQQGGYHPGPHPGAQPHDPYHGQYAAAPDPYAAQQRALAQPALAPQLTTTGAEPEGPYEDDEYEEEDEPESGSNKWMLVAALVGAIGLGGGLAYAYKTFSGGGKSVTAQNANPASKPKTVAVAPPPAPPQGKKIDAKLPEAVPQVAVAPTADGTSLSSGPVPVKTFVVPPPGAPAGAMPTPQPQPRPTVQVPGVMLDNLPPVRQQAPPQQLQIAAAPQAAAPQVAPAPPKVQLRAPAPAAPEPVAAAEPAPVKKAPPKQVAAKQPTADAYNPNATPGTTGGVVAANSTTAAPKEKAAGLGAGSAATGGNGFVAVLTSHKTKMDALRAYADLQQKYAEVLGSKPVDVQEANLGEAKGGVWYRAVVGPPGSREAAANVCAKLKAAGYTGCWPNAY